VTAGEIGEHELPTAFAVWRTTLVDDGQGGEEETTAEVGQVRGKVNQPTAAEVVVAQQSGVELTYAVHLLPGADVERGDQLRDGTDHYRVKAVFVPSEPVYKRADCELHQGEE
jgi:hypothetical protein